MERETILEWILKWGWVIMIIIIVVGALVSLGITG